MSISSLSRPVWCCTVRTARRAREHIRVDQRETNFVPMEEEISWVIASSSVMSTGLEMEVMMSRASARARLKADIMTTGWMLRSSWGRAMARISPAARLVLALECMAYELK